MEAAILPTLIISLFFHLFLVSSEETGVPSEETVVPSEETRIRGIISLHIHYTGGIMKEKQVCLSIHENTDRLYTPH